MITIFQSWKTLCSVAGLALVTLVTLAPIQSTQAQDVRTSSLDEYWTMEEFNHINPYQRQTIDAFSRRVAGPAEPPSTVNSDIRVAVIYPGSQQSDYWRRSLLSFEARLQELQVDAIVDAQFVKPSDPAGHLSRLVAKALKSDPDYLVLTLDKREHKVIAQQLIARGRPKVILQNITTPVRAWRERQPFLYVGFDHVAGTRLLIDHYRLKLGARKDFAILYGQRGYVSRARGNTFLQAYSDPEAVNLKASYYVGYDRERSREAATKILNENPDIALIYACSTEIALGVLDAIRLRGADTPVMANGWGGGSAELDALATGDLDVTVMRMNDDNGVAMAEAIALDQAGRGAEVPVVYSGAFVLVTSNDSQQRVATLKAKAFRYSR